MPTFATDYTPTTTVATNWQDDAPVIGDLLLETGDSLLLESGDHFLI